jgi:hypothetical protein
MCITSSTPENSLKPNPSPNLPKTLPHVDTPNFLLQHKSHLAVPYGGRQDARLEPKYKQIPLVVLVNPTL